MSTQPENQEPKALQPTPDQATSGQSVPEAQKSEQPTQSFTDQESPDQKLPAEEPQAVELPAQEPPTSELPAEEVPPPELPTEELPSQELTVQELPDTEEQNLEAAEEEQLVPADQMPDQENLAEEALESQPLEQENPLPQLPEQQISPQLTQEQASIDQQSFEQASAEQQTPQQPAPAPEESAAFAADQPQPSPEAAVPPIAQEAEAEETSIQQTEAIEAESHATEVSPSELPAKAIDDAAPAYTSVAEPSPSQTETASTQEPAETTVTETATTAAPEIASVASEEKIPAEDTMPQPADLKMEVVVAPAGEAEEEPVSYEERESASTQPKSLDQSSLTMENADTPMTPTEQPAAAQQQEILALEETPETFLTAESETARNEADTAMERAISRVSWAENNDIDESNPNEFANAMDAMEAARIAYANERYSAVVILANEVSTTLSEDLITKTTAEPPRAQDVEKPKETVLEPEPAHEPEPAPEPEPIRTATPQPMNATSDQEQTAIAQMAAAAETPVAETPAAEPPLAENPAMETPIAETPAAQTAAAAESSAPPKVSEVAETAEASTDSISVSILLKAAESSHEKALARNAEHNYPELFAQGWRMLEEAKAANASGNYQKAAQKAGAAYETLSAIPEFAILPAYYVVRKLPSPGDYLWKIAGYPFIYNDPEAWPLLYDANKATFRFPSKPTHLYPGQVLEIPSLRGEKRQGAWDPEKTYKPLAE